MRRYLPFSIICCASIVLTYLLRTYIITDGIYFESLAERLSHDQITDFIQTAKAWEWVAYTMTPVLLSIKCITVALCISTGMFLLNNRFDFGRTLGVVVIAEFIFLIPAAIKLIWFLFIQTSYSLNDVQYFSALSMLHFFDITLLEVWLIYPLQVLNIFELFYWVTLAYLISLKFVGMDITQSMKIVVFSYCSSLAVWVGTVMFLTLMMTS